MFCSALRFIQYSMLRGISAQWLVNTRNFCLSIEVWNKVKNNKGFMNGGTIPRFHTSEKCRTKKEVKKLWISSPLSQGLDDRALPYLKVWTRQCRYITTTK